VIGAIFLLSVGTLILIPSVLGSIDAIPSIIQWTSGNGDGSPYPYGCPDMTGIFCTYGGIAVGGIWAFLFDAIGGILLFLGVRRIINERRNAVASNSTNHERAT